MVRTKKKTSDHLELLNMAEDRSSLNLIRLQPYSCFISTIDKFQIYENSTMTLWFIVLLFY